MLPSAPYHPATKAGGKESILCCMFSLAQNGIGVSRGPGWWVILSKAGRGFLHLQTSPATILALFWDPGPMLSALLLNSLSHVILTTAL